MVKITEGLMDEYIVDITDKSKYDYYRYNGVDFAYDRKNGIVLYLYKDEDDGNYYEVDSIGLRPENWKNKAVRDEYLAEYIDEINAEAQSYADDFIKYELPYLNANIVKKESKSRKLVGFYDMEDVLYKPYNEWKYCSVEDVIKESNDIERIRYVVYTDDVRGTEYFDDIDSAIEFAEDNDYDAVYKLIYYKNGEKEFDGTVWENEDSPFWM